MNQGNQGIFRDELIKMGFSGMSQYHTLIWGGPWHIYVITKFILVLGVLALLGEGVCPRAKMKKYLVLYAAPAYFSLWNY